MVHHKRKTCRACNGTSLRPFLNLGKQPLANSFLKSESEFSAEAVYHGGILAWADGEDCREGVKTLFFRYACRAPESLSDAALAP